MRIVVVGVGAVTSQGIGAEALWSGARQGRVAIRPVKGLPMTGYRTELGGEVPAEVDHPHGEPALGFALEAAAEALRGAKLPEIPAERWGVAFGSCNGGLISGEIALRDHLAGHQTDPRTLLLVSPQTIAETIGTVHGLRGPVLSVNTACASGAHAIAHGVELIRGGLADAVLVGGSDSLSPITFSGFNSLESLSPEPAAPYSRERDGLSLGEGSGMLVLVRDDLARRHGLAPLAEVLGYGLSADGYHATAPRPDGAGAARAIRTALATSGVRPAEVGYVNGHGTGTPKNDPAEVNAIKAVFGATPPKQSSTKSMIGHLLGAAGAVEGIVTIMALRDQIAPPTAGFRSRDPHCDLDVVPNEAVPLETDVVVSNNFAFAGANASVVYGRAGRSRAPAGPWQDPVVITGIAGLAPGEDPASSIPPKRRRRMDRLGRLAVVAGERAMEQAGLDASERVGVVLGTGLGPMESMERFMGPIIEDGPAFANPAVFPNTVYNAAAGQVAMALGTTGPTSTLTALHAAGATALLVARDLLRNGAADAIVVPAVDVVPEPVRAAYGRLLPGLTVTEGGFALVLERRSVAEARGATVLAELGPFGFASDGLGPGRWDRNGAGLERAMRTVLEMSGLAPGDIVAVWATAAGVKTADRAESAAIARVFGGRPPRIEAPKCVLGEPVGAGSHLLTRLALGDAATGPMLVNSSSLSGTHLSFLLTKEAV